MPFKSVLKRPGTFIRDRRVESVQVWTEWGVKQRERKARRREKERHRDRSSGHRESRDRDARGGAAKRKSEARDGGSPAAEGVEDGAGREAKRARGASGSPIAAAPVAAEPDGGGEPRHVGGGVIDVEPEDGEL